MHYITAEEVAPGYTVYHVDHPACQATVARRGAQVLGWAPSGQPPVLYWSEQASYEIDVPARAGVPICWPWFADHPTDASKPLHGFVMTKDWTLHSTGEFPGGVRMEFFLETDPETRKIWPHDFRLEVHLELGAELMVRLVTFNTGRRSYPMSGALHSYLATGPLRDIRICGLEQAPYFDKITNEPSEASGEPLRLMGEAADRIYQAAGPTEVHDPGLQRTIIVANSGGPATVIWNPGHLLPGEIPDIAATDAEKFVAVEAVIPQGQEVRLEPGASYALSTRISLLRASAELGDSATQASTPLIFGTAPS